jgi:PAS domain S-box-containing protein
MRRVSPVHILASEDPEIYLLAIGISTHERIINVSQNCIVCTGATGVIEMVNPAVSETFGHTSKQVLSLPFTTLINEDNAEKISQQMSLIVNHQSSPVFESHTVCTAEDQSETPCSISILASFVDGHIAQFVSILKDESAPMQQQQTAESAKQQSANLLYQILQRSIVTRINAGENDISLTVPSATIMFIDIAKFSQYALNLTPQDIMGNLSMIFAGFNQKVTKYYAVELRPSCTISRILRAQRAQNAGQGNLTDPKKLSSRSSLAEPWLQSHICERHVDRSFFHGRTINAVYMIGMITIIGVDWLWARRRAIRGPIGARIGRIRPICARYCAWPCICADRPSQFLCMPKTDLPRPQIDGMHVISLMLFIDTAEKRFRRSFFYCCTPPQIPLHTAQKNRSHVQNSAAYKIFNATQD